MNTGAMRGLRAQLDALWGVVEPSPALPPERKAEIVAEVAAKYNLDPAELGERMALVEPVPLPLLRPGMSRSQIVAQVAEAYGVDPGELWRDMERS